MGTLKRIGIASAVALLIGANISLSNGNPLTTAIRDGLLFSIVVAYIVAIIAWGLKLSAAKGYPVWAGFGLALFLNIIGIAVLWLLPDRKKPGAKS